MLVLRRCTKSCSGQKQKTAQRESFRAGYPADVPGSFGRTSRFKNFRQVLETWENKHFGADIRDPNVQTSMTWPRGSTSVERHGYTYPTECSQQLWRDPTKNRSSKSFGLKRSSEEGTPWDSSLLVSLTLCWDAPVLCSPALPLSQHSEKSPSP